MDKVFRIMNGKMMIGSAPRKRKRNANTRGAGSWAPGVEGNGAKTPGPLLCIVRILVLL